jgi:hypothetical protein
VESSPRYGIPGIYKPVAAAVGYQTLTAGNESQVLLSGVTAGTFSVVSSAPLAAFHTRTNSSKIRSPVLAVRRESDALHGELMPLDVGAVARWPHPQAELCVTRS